MTSDYALPAELTIYTIGEVHAQCLNWMKQDQAEHIRLRINAGEVTEVDAAGIQLLLSLSKSLLADHRELQLLSPSTALAAACSALGVDSLLGSPERKGAAQ
ncbi:MAG: STAS domain-containing protein [Aquabacterium sp.]|uniref:STAS domain-containing protein n=1 Tax=Aquabacterium sp. TaxID=1872578 RepID=UPI0012066685|nr:STAS domain-containing protein [Aquabacterium sp.]TAK97684.1 MAG: STAS domain-containing protein [Aquabacterium sp.]